MAAAEPQCHRGGRAEVGVAGQRARRLGAAAPQHRFGCVVGLDLRCAGLCASSCCCPWQPCVHGAWLHWPTAATASGCLNSSSRPTLFDWTQDTGPDCFVHACRLTGLTWDTGPGFLLQVGRPRRQRMQGSSWATCAGVLIVNNWSDVVVCCAQCAAPVLAHAIPHWHGPLFCAAVLFCCCSSGVETHSQMASCAVSFIRVRSWRELGSARLECVGGCRCPTLRLEHKWKHKSTQTALVALEVLDQECAGGAACAAATRLLGWHGFLCLGCQLLLRCHPAHSVSPACPFSCQTGLPAPAV